jgi:hypothetical protein
MGRRFRTIICLVPEFKPGDPPPEGYLDWHEWARVQAKAGLRQARRACGHWHFPHEPACKAPAIVGVGKGRKG